MGSKKKSLLVRAILFTLLAIFIGMSWHFSSQTGVESNLISAKYAKAVEEYIGRYFIINTGDTFWNTTLNQIIRKMAHFFEYLLIGLIMCIMLNVIFEAIWIAALGSMLFSSLLGCIDEYHQIFTLGRTPRWFDIQVDSAGALIGIAMATIFFCIFNYIQNLNRKIDELEKDKFM
ncbi:MAG: VanZ family protein [Syntrophomonas sp.]